MHECSAAETSSLRLFCILALLHFCIASTSQAHDLERTRVSLTVGGDGSFVLDVSNDPAWLKLRLESFPGPFADRIVLFVDGHEVRPTSTEFIPVTSAQAESGGTSTENPLATHRLRGQMPLDTRTLRWYYGLVGDPYPLVVRLADGTVRVEEIQGDAWSGAIDLGGQFARPARWPNALVAGLLVAGLLLRLRSRFRSRGSARLA
jgi:hypothetical protein